MPGLGVSGLRSVLYYERHATNSTLKTDAAVKKLLFILIAALSVSAAHAQQRNDDVWVYPLEKFTTRYNIRIPDIDGYHTMKCDFHVHTVFSDGQVYPTGRVNEAWNDGLDAIAITDHIEYHKFTDYIPVGDLNAPYEIARRRGQEINLIVIPGSEITRSKPLGHLNALFVTDANELRVDDELEAVDAAWRQGAYILLNHPGWPDKNSDLFPVHEKLIAEGKLRGIEVFNGTESYPKAYGYCTEYGLAPFADTDIHQMSGHLYRGKLERPMTLVFAKEHSAEAIKEALFAGRTLAFFAHNLFGSGELISQLVDKCLRVKPLVDPDKPKKRTIEVINDSDITFSIVYGNYQYPVEIPGGCTVRIDLDQGSDVTFTNCITGKDEYFVRKLW